MLITGSERDLSKKTEIPQKAKVFVWFGQENSDKGNLICKSCKKEFRPTQQQVESVLKEEKTLIQLDCKSCQELNSGYIFKKEYGHWQGEFVPVITSVPVNFLSR